MNYVFRKVVGIGACALTLVLARPGLAQTDPSDNTVRFQGQLLQRHSTYSWHAGWASFQVQAGQLQFQVFLESAFTNFCGVVLRTDSRQATVQMGTGQFMFLPMCEPVLVPGSDPPIWISCDGFRAVTAHAGSIPLNETLLRELLAGQGEIFVHLPAKGANGNYWAVPPPLQGSLLQAPGGDVEAALAGLPRTPRSLSAVVGAGPVSFPFDYGFNAAVDVDQDGVGDYGLHGRTLCTMSIPSDCATTFGVSCLSSNQLLAQGWNAVVVPLGTSIGPAAPPNAAWGQPGLDSLTSTLSGSCYRPWSGELGRLGEAYLGVKLRRADGDHYGWIRVRLPKGRPLFTFQPLFSDSPDPRDVTIDPPAVASPGEYSPMEPLVWEFGPVIEEWAFEPAPNTPILAGAKPFPVRVACGGVQRPGYLRMSFRGEAGRAYAVQFRPDLTAHQWGGLGWLLIPTAPETVLDLPTSGGMGFYRVVEAE